MGSGTQELRFLSVQSRKRRPGSCITVRRLRTTPYLTVMTTVVGGDVFRTVPRRRVGTTFGPNFTGWTKSLPNPKPSGRPMFLDLTPPEKDNSWFRELRKKDYLILSGQTLTEIYMSYSNSNPHRLGEQGLTSVSALDLTWVNLLSLCPEGSLLGPSTQFPMSPLFVCSLNQI